MPNVVGADTTREGAHVGDIGVGIAVVELHGIDRVARDGDGGRADHYALGAGIDGILAVVRGGDSVVDASVHEGGNGGAVGSGIGYDAAVHAVVLKGKDRVNAAHLATTVHHGVGGNPIDVEGMGHEVGSKRQVLGGHGDDTVRRPAVEEMTRAGYRRIDDGLAVEQSVKELESIVHHAAVEIPSNLVGVAEVGEDNRGVLGNDGTGTGRTVGVESHIGDSVCHEGSVASEHVCDRVAQHKAVVQGHLVMLDGVLHISQGIIMLPLGVENGVLSEFVF